MRSRVDESNKAARNGHDISERLDDITKIGFAIITSSSLREMHG